MAALNPDAPPFLVPHKNYLPPPPPQLVTPPPPPQFYHQPAPSCAYPPVLGPIVWYNTHRQPLPAATMVPYSLEHVNKESSVYNMKARSAVMRNWMNNIKVGPRLRCNKREKLDESCVVKLWVPKKFASDDKKSHGESFATKSSKSEANPVEKVLQHCPVDNEDGAIDVGDKTSLMIRNIPNQFLRHHLMDILDKHCLEENKKAKLQSDPNMSEYDFLYLPMDFRKRANYGYAFVNFTNSAGAMRFSKCFNKHKWDVSFSKKICEVCCALIQGKDSLRIHFKNSVFPCHTNEYLPVVFSPPRNGLALAKPTVIGKRRVGAAAVYQRK